MLVHVSTWPKNENFGGEDGVGSGAPAIYLKDLMTACHNNSDQEVAQSLESIYFGSLSIENTMSLSPAFILRLSPEKVLV